MKRIVLAMGVVFMFFSKAQAEALKVGSPAPDFSAPASNGSRVHLMESLHLAPIVLYFYPKDDTPGCTKEACGIRDDFGAFRNLKATVYGISYDSIKSHQKFIQKYRLPFVLLSDLDHSISKAYGANGIFVPRRQTFVIDKKGVIVYINRSVNPASHSIELQNALTQL